MLAPLSSNRPSSKRQPNITLTTPQATQHGQAHQQWPAYLVRIEAEVDPNTRMHYLIARIDDPYRLRAQDPTTRPSTTPASAALKSGSFVQAKIQGRTLKQVLAIPRARLMRNDEIFTLDGDNRLRILAVDVLHQQHEIVLVRLKNTEHASAASIAPTTFITLISSALAEPVEGMLLTPNARSEAETSPLKGLKVQPTTKIKQTEKTEKTEKRS